MRTPTDAFDDLAALFLTEDAPAERSGVAPLDVRLLVVGHAPVMAGLWLAQLADRLARERGPVALLRCDEPEVSLEVFNAGGRRLAFREARSMRAAIDDVARVVQCWMVRPDPRLRLPSLLNAGADRITLLTSVDEAAVVSAYRTIKELAEAAAARGEPPTPIELAVVGASEERAQAVVDRLNRTASAFLGVALSLLTSIPRMEPLDSAGQVSFPREDPRKDPREDPRENSRGNESLDGHPTLGDLLDWIVESSTNVARRFNETVAAGESPLPNDAAPVAGRRRLVADVMPSAGDTDAGGSTQTTLDAADAVPAARRRLAAAIEARSGMGHPEGLGTDARSGGGIEQVAPQPAAAPVHRRQTTHVEREPGDRPAVIETHRPGEGSEPRRREDANGVSRAPSTKSVDHRADTSSSLATAIGLSVLPIACPDHPDVELAVDEGGRLHLVTALTNLASLVAAEGWAERHRALLRRAFPDAIRDERPARLHVVTAELADGLALAGSRIEAHLRAPVRGPHGVVWYVSPLSTAAPRPNG